jgi:Cu+-exporting ATPase
MPVQEIATDPVCGMLVDTSHSAGSLEHEGVRYHFCAVRCLERFRKDPSRFLSGGTSADAGDPDAEYFCPMDPEVVQKGPGTCPKCGMALERSGISLSDAPDPEYIDMVPRLRVSTALTLPVFAIAMGEMVPGFPETSSQFLGDGARTILLWTQAALTAPVVAWCGLPFFRRAAASVANRSPNMFTLIGIGTATAFIFSLLVMLAPGILPPSLQHQDGVQVYFETSAVIITLVLLGQVLELRARGRTGSAIRELIGLWPATATVLADDGSEMTVPREDVEPGDLIRVKANESVPTDGTVTQGSSWVDESMVTGESVPSAKEAGDTVIGGTINGSGTFVMRATANWDATLLARIIRMVTDAQRSRAPIQRLADTVSSYFVPAVIGIAVLSMAVWTVLGLPLYGLVTAVSVLIIACPCALGLATPMSVTVGLGEAAKHGILIRDAEALETLSKVDTLVIDKTGTLTMGRPDVKSVIPLGAAGVTDVLRIAASLERTSEHPIAKAITDRAAQDGIDLLEVRDFVSMTGIGVRGTVSGEVAEVRRPSEESLRLAAAEHASGSVVEVAKGGEVVGIIITGDAVKESAREVVAALKREGVRIMMLTGDNERAAASVAEALGIGEYRSGVLPDEKATLVKGLKTGGGFVAMAGDGVNDAPALAVADVSIAMGTGTEIAMEASQVTLVKGDLEGILRARRLSRGTLANVRQNLFFAFFYNLLGVPVAAGVLFPFIGVLLSPMIAALAMTFSSVSVIGNALRLRGFKVDG